MAEESKHLFEVTPDGDKATILVAEDDHINFLFLNELLEYENFNVIHAVNGRIAVDICKENKSISLVLMDYLMPVMDGSSAAKLIKVMRPELPIILQTAYSFENIDIPEGLFIDLISKPIKPETLRQKLARYISQ